MKKTRKFIIAISFSLFIIFGFSSKVYALDETKSNEITENETDTSKWFDKELIGYVIEFGTAFSAAFIAVGSFIKSFKNIRDALNKDTNKKEELASKITEDRDKIIQCNEYTARIIKKNNEETQKAIFEDNYKTREDIEKLLKVLSMVYVNNDKLVKSGVANEIAKILGDSNENTKA